MTPLNTYNMNADLTLLTDEVLIDRIVNQKEEALYSVLYDRYMDKVFRKCMSFVKNEDVAMDMVQDILLKAYTRLDRFKGNSKFSTWLYAITYNYCVEHYRKETRYTQIDINEGADIAEPDDQFLNDLQSSRTTKLKKALQRISEEDRDLLVMKYYQNVSIKELMDKLQLTESAVKMRLARARQRIKHLISQAEAIEDTFKAPRNLMPVMVSESMMTYHSFSSVAWIAK